MSPFSSKNHTLSKGYFRSADNEKLLEIKNDISYDRDQGKIFLKAKIYSRKNENKKSSGFLEKIAKAVDEIFRRYYQWQAKEWFVEFVDKNFEKNKKTRDLLESVRYNGNVPVSSFLEILVDKEYGFFPPVKDLHQEGSINSRYSIEKKDQIVSQLISEELENKKFQKKEIDAFCNFLHFGTGSLTPESVKDVMSFLNRYSDESEVDKPVFQIAALQAKVIEMQRAVPVFEARQQQLASIRSRGNSNDAPVQGKSVQYSRLDLCQFLERQWGCAFDDATSGAIENAAGEDRLRISFLRYLRQGTKNFDENFLENLINFARATSKMPDVFGFSNKGDSNAPGLNKLFNEVVEELNELRREEESKNVGIESPEAIEYNADIVKQCMNKIFRSCASARNLFMPFIFPEMMNYAKTGDKKIVEEKKDAFSTAAAADIEAVANLANFYEFEKKEFDQFIKKLKSDIS